MTAEIIPQELSAYATGLTLNNEDLVSRFKNNMGKGLFTPKAADPIKNFMDFLGSYKTNMSLLSTAEGPSSSSS
ncbi:MAG: hypothetical protein JNJ47_00405 [Alphaproteobacteria bacterium]|nr:hypothetical protein [Alphaproteobacteria bacterium]